MKLISRFIFCCLTFSSLCYGSHTESKKWSWPLATALGFKKTITTTLAKNNSFDCEWPADELKTRKQTPSPDIVCIGLQGEEQPAPLTVLQAAPKLSQLLQTEILIAGAKLPTPPKSSPADLRSQIPAAANLTLSVPASKSTPTTPTSAGSTPDAPRSNNSIAGTPPAALSYETCIDLLVTRTSTHLSQPNPIHVTQQSSYQNSPEIPTHFEVDRNSSDSMINQPKTPQFSIISMIMAGCCPCLPPLSQNNENSKKKSEQ